MSQTYFYIWVEDKVSRSSTLCSTMEEAASELWDMVKPELDEGWKDDLEADFLDDPEDPEMTPEERLDAIMALVQEQHRFGCGWDEVYGPTKAAMEA